MHNRITSLVFYKSQWITRIQPFSSSTWRIAGWDEYYKNGNFQHLKPVRFYSPTMYLWKNWLAKLRFFSPHVFFLYQLLCNNKKAMHKFYNTWLKTYKTLFTSSFGKACIFVPSLFWLGRSSRDSPLNEKLLIV